MTKTQWANLSPKQQWDCLVALRGPDCYHSEKIKWFTTSVIRGQMGEIMRVGGLVNNEMKLVILPHDLCIPNPIVVKDHPLQFGWCGDHFFTHTYEAAINLGIPILLVNSTLWMKLAQTSFHKMITELVEWCEKNKVLKGSIKEEMEKLMVLYPPKQPSPYHFLNDLMPLASPQPPSISEKEKG